MYLPARIHCSTCISIFHFHTNLFSSLEFDTSCPTCLLFHPRYCILASFISIWETWLPRWYPTGCLDCWRKVNAGIFMQKKTHENFTWPPHPEDWARLANWMQFCPLVSSSLKGILKGMWWTILVMQQSYLCNPGRYMIQGNS
jgi:hypothetical protein